MRKKKKYKKPPRKFSSNVVEALQVPKDLAFGAAIITVTGQTEAFIENYRGIMEYSKEKIKVHTKTCKIEITGTNLHIDYYTNDEMKITGLITQITYSL